MADTNHVVVSPSGLGKDSRSKPVAYTTGRDCVDPPGLSVQLQKAVAVLRYRAKAIGDGHSSERQKQSRENAYHDVAHRR